MKLMFADAILGGHRTSGPGPHSCWNGTYEKARLILTCGLPAAGKTALAKELAVSPWDRDVGEKIEQELWRLAQDILRLGVSVVLDFGLWARVERDEMRTAARGLGVGVELHYLEVPLDQLWQRIEVRNSTPRWDSEPITRADLEEWHAAFQAPDAAELALFDAVG